MQAEALTRMKLESRGLEQNLIEKADMARSLQDLSDDRKDEIEKLAKMYEQEVSEKDRKLDDLRLKLSGNDQQAVLLADMERLKKAHADALSGKESELQKIREQILSNELQPSLHDQISRLKLEHSEALSDRDAELGDLRTQLEKAQ